MYYQLTSEEINAAKEITERREEFNKNNKIIGYKKDKNRTNKEITFNGVCGEIAFNSLLLREGLISKKEWISNLVEIKKLKHISATKGEDEGDLKLKRKNIDVKTSEYDTASLWITKTKTGKGRYDNNIDYFVLMTGGEKTFFNFVFRGFISHDEFKSNYERFRGKWPQYKLNQVLKEI